MHALRPVSRSPAPFTALGAGVVGEFSDDGSTALLCGSPGAEPLHVYDCVQKRAICSVYTGLEREARAFMPRAAGEGGESGDLVVVVGKKVWSIDTSLCMRVLRVPIDVAYLLAAGPAPSRLVAIAGLSQFGFAMSRIFVCDVDTGEAVCELQLNGGAPFTRSMAFSPDCSRIVTGSCSGVVSVYNARDGSFVREVLDCGHVAGERIQVAFASSAERIICTTTAGSTIVVRASDGEPEGFFWSSGLHSESHVSACARDAPLAARASYGEVCVWSVTTRELIARIDAFPAQRRTRDDRGVHETKAAYPVHLSFGRIRATNKVSVSVGYDTGEFLVFALEQPAHGAALALLRAAEEPSALGSFLRRNGDNSALVRVLQLSLCW